jgi:L-arabinose isomerase
LDRPLRIGLLTPYFSFFDQRFPRSFRESQEEYARALAGALTSHHSTAVASGLVDSSEAALVAEKAFKSEGVDVVVVAPLMAAPPGFLVPMIHSLELPVVIWLDDRADAVDESIDEMEATRQSSFLGAIMLSSALRAAGVRYHVIATEARNGESILRAARGAAVKTMLRGLRLGVIGGPIPGYTDVLLDDHAAHALGVCVVQLGSDLFTKSYVDSKVPADSFWTSLSTLGIVKADAQPALASSIALTLDLQRIVDENDISALVINCHADYLRWHKERGIVGCLGASVLTTAGVPVSCTGDAATAVPLAIATWLARDTQYAEGYVIGRHTGELLISSCGLANFNLRNPSHPLEFRGNDLYPGARGNGCCVRMAFTEGPTTLLAFGGNSPTLRPRFVWTTGIMSGRYFAEMNGPSGTLSFDAPFDRQVSAKWVAAGPSHHFAVARGHLDVELKAAAEFLDADFLMAGSDQKGGNA